MPSSASRARWRAATAAGPYSASTRRRATAARDADIAVIGAGATVRDVVKPGEQIEPGDVVG